MLRDPPSCGEMPPDVAAQYSGSTYCSSLRACRRTAMGAAEAPPLQNGTTEAMAGRERSHARGKPPKLSESASDLSDGLQTVFRRDRSWRAR